MELVNHSTACGTVAPPFAAGSPSGLYLVRLRLEPLHADRGPRCGDGGGLARRAVRCASGGRGLHAQTAYATRDGRGPCWRRSR